jgi:hypothetical protein
MFLIGWMDQVEWERPERVLWFVPERGPTRG